VENIPLLNVCRRKKKPMKRSLYIILTGLVLMASLSTGCCPVQYDGDYTGRVVDAETGEPIEGAVVLGTWDFVSSSVAGALYSFYDAAETITDAQGNFTVPGRGLMFLSCLDSMDATVFKTGYECLDHGWDSLKIDSGLRGKIQWDGEIPVIRLRKLTMEERREQDVPSPPSEINWENFPLYMKELNKDRIERGRKPLSMHKEKLDEGFM